MEESVKSTVGDALEVDDALMEKTEESVEGTLNCNLPDDLEECLQVIAGQFPVEEQKLRMYSPLSFAYIGDSVFDLIIRTMVTTKGNTRPNQYHHQTIHYVNAAAQRQMMDKIKPYLTEQERVIYRRGKNAKPATCAKNQSHHDYRIATGFEALIGYLYLTGQMHRIMELVTIGLKRMI